MKSRLVLMTLFGIASTAATYGADDDLEAVKTKLVGKWHYTNVKPGKNDREMTVEFTKDGNYIYTPENKTFKVRKGTFKLTAKDTVEVQITEGLVKGEKKTTKSARFLLEGGKLWFDPALLLNLEEVPMKEKMTELSKIPDKK